MSLRPSSPPAPAREVATGSAGLAIRADVPMTEVISGQDFLNALRQNVLRNRESRPEPVPGVPVPNVVEGTPVPMEQEKPTMNEYAFRVLFMSVPTDPTMMFIRIYDLANEVKEQQIADVIISRVPGSYYRVIAKGHLKVCAKPSDSYFYINLKSLSPSVYGPNVFPPKEMADLVFSRDNMIVLENGAMKGVYGGVKPVGGSGAEYYFYK